MDAFFLVKWPCRPTLNSQRQLDTRSICEPTGALSLAGAKKYLALHPELKTRGAHIAIISGANVNFDRLRFISDRAELGEQTEAFCNVIIPERPGSFKNMIRQVHPRAITEFSYRYSDPKDAHIYISFKVQNLENEVPKVLDAWKQHGMHGWDVSHNELAKTHARYMVGGRGRPANERVFRFSKCGKIVRICKQHNWPRPRQSSQSGLVPLSNS